MDGQTPHGTAKPYHMAKPYHFDCFGRIFESRRKQGRDADFWLGEADLATNDVVWHRIDHSKCDGIGGFKHFLDTTKGISAVRLNASHVSRIPSRWKRLRDLLVENRRLSQVVVAWDIKADEIQGQGHAPVHWHVFTAEQTSALDKHARCGGVSLNTVILSAFNCVMGAGLVKAGFPYMWYMPVNLRGSVKLPVEASNHIAFIAVDANADTTLRELHTRIKEQLASGKQWAAWLAIWLIGHAGQRLRARILAEEEKRTACLGQFSNLGAWSAPDAPANQAWLFVPPLFANAPVAVGAVQWNGRLALTLRCHGKVRSDSRDSAHFTAVVNDLLAKAGELMKRAEAKACSHIPA